MLHLTHELCPPTFAPICCLLTRANLPLTCIIRPLACTRHPVNPQPSRVNVPTLFTEAGRVFAFRSVCESGGEDALRRMGRLMDESHASCRDQYECSHERLDTVCRLAEGVAYGARLTGAG